MTNTTKIIEVTTPSHFPTKLTATNFPSWHKQVLSTLIGLDLDQFIDGSVEAPPKTIDGKSNPNFRPWFRQDQLLLGALLGSCSDTIQPMVSSAATARELFQRLTETFASTSRSRIISLKTKLATTTKGTKSMTEYLNEMKAIADDLALAQQPIKDEDLIVHILTQLGDDYKHAAVSLRFQATPITFADLFDKLVDYERDLQPNIPQTLIATVNQTQRQRGRFSRAGYGDKSQNKPTNYGPRHNSSNYNSGSSTNFRGNRNSFFCQYCNIPGHDTKDCRKLARFLQDNNITISATPPTNPMVNSSMASSPFPIPPWMLDSGASHHITSDRASLNNLSEYGGPDEIVLGNGKGSSNGGATNAGGER